MVSRGISDEEEFTPADFVERTEDVLEDLDRLEAAFDSDRIMITSEPTTIIRCKPETVRAMKDWALKRGKMWHIHLAQTSDELAEAMAKVGMGSVQYAEKLGVLGPEMLAIHCSGLLDEEVELFGKYRVNVSHCPLTVMRGGNRVPPIWEMTRLGAMVAVGTDGSATNNGQNPWEAMKMAVYMQRVRYQDRYLGTAEEALELTTIKAAAVLDLADGWVLLSRARRRTWPCSGWTSLICCRGRDWSTTWCIRDSTIWRTRCWWEGRSCCGKVARFSWTRRK